MSTKRCPQCGSDYLSTVERCADCGVDLEDVEVSDDGHDVDESHASGTDADVLDGRVSVDRSTGRVRYALDDWASETRVMIGQLLAGEGIPFLWEAGTLVVTTEFRLRVDDLVLQADVISGAVFDPDVETSIYELDQWSDAQVNRLAEMLSSAGIAFVFDIEGNLVVAADDEDRVEDVFDELDLDDDDDTDDGGIVDTTDPQAALSELFVAVDRLRRNARDHQGVLGLVSAVEQVESIALPFGFAPELWSDLVGQARRLRTAIEEDSMTDEQIETASLELRTLLHDCV